MNLLYLCAAFFQIGLFAIGGGLATLPFLYQLADKSDWLDRLMIGDMQAVAQSLPGAIGVNLAAYTGFQFTGISGGFAAALGLVSPSIIIIIIVARMFKAFKENKLAGLIFSGLRPAAGGLLAAAGFGAVSLSLYNGAASVWYELFRWREAVLFGVLFFLIFKFKKHPVLYIAAAGAAGVFLNL
jgi:chromate transporter